MADLPQDILDGISRCLSKSPERLVRLMYFLLNEVDIARYIGVLKSLIDNEEAFNKIVAQLADDADKLHNDPDYRRVMADLWNNYLKPNEQAEVGSGQRFDYKLLLASDQTQALATISFIQTLSRLPPSAQRDIVNVTMSVAEAALGSGMAMALRQSANNALSFSRNVSGKMVGVTLAAVYLAYDVLQNMQRWWKGEITGARCGKIVIDSIAGMAAGVGGGIAGAAIGTSIAGPFGAVIGGLIGGLVSASAMNAISDWATQKLFNLPKEEALENAYRFLKLSYGASNNEINTSFRRLALEYHPDKGGSYENWHQLQLSLALIKVSKGEV